MSESIAGEIASSSSPADHKQSKIEELQASRARTPDVPVELSRKSTALSQNDPGPNSSTSATNPTSEPPSDEVVVTANAPIHSEQEANQAIPAAGQTEVDAVGVLSSSPSKEESTSTKTGSPQSAPDHEGAALVTTETAPGENAASEEHPVQPVTNSEPNAATPAEAASAPATVERNDSNLSDSGGGKSPATAETSPSPNNIHHVGNDDDLDEYIKSPHGQNAIVERSPGGRYVRFMEKLGSGASKDVYRAYDTQEGIEVAWNVVSLAGVPKTERNRIVNEVRLLERLHHHNIISFHGSWVNRERQEVHFVTEILSSGTLKSFINKVQVIRWKIAKRWAVQILKGLEYLHSQDPPVIHRDLKCDNIFINGTSGDLRIGDLGLSTVHRNGRVLSVLGTPEFMAPDMYEEERSYDEKVDIYAFGMCMLEIFTKEIPYKECKNPAQIYKKVSTGELPEVLSRLQSKHARDFIMLCLGYRDGNGVFMRPTASELLQHDFLVKRVDDDDEVMVDPPLIKRTITEEKSVSPSSSSLRQPPDQIQLQQSDSGSKVGGAQPVNTESQSQLAYQKQGSVDEDESDRFDEMPDSEVNFRKVKVLMGRGQELKEEETPPNAPIRSMGGNSQASSIADRQPEATAQQQPTAPATNALPDSKNAAKKELDPGIAPVITHPGHYLVAAAVIENEADRAYPDDILKLVVTLPVEGQTQNVQFDFHLVEDDPVQVGKEMVAELGIPPGAVLEISETVSGLACAARMQRDKFKMRAQQNLHGQLPPTSQRFSQEGQTQSQGPQPVGNQDLQQGTSVHQHQQQIGQMSEYGNGQQVPQQTGNGQPATNGAEQPPIPLSSQSSHVVDGGQSGQMQSDAHSQTPHYGHAPNLMQVPLHPQGQQSQHLGQQGGQVNPMVGEPASYNFDHGQGQMQQSVQLQAQQMNLGNNGGSHMPQNQSNLSDRPPLHSQQQPMNYSFDGGQGQGQVHLQPQHLVQNVVQQSNQNLPDGQSQSSGSYSYDPRQTPPNHMNALPTHQVMQRAPDPQAQPLYNPGQQQHQQQPQPQLQQQQLAGLHQAPPNPENAQSQLRNQGHAQQMPSHLMHSQHLGQAGQLHNQHAGQPIQNISDVNQPYGHGQLPQQPPIPQQAPFATVQQPQSLPYPQSPNPHVHQPPTNHSSSGAVYEKGVSAPNANAQRADMAASSAGLKRSVSTNSQPIANQQLRPPAMQTIQSAVSGDQQMLPPSRTSSGNVSALVRGDSAGSDQNGNEDGAGSAIAESSEDSDVNDELRQLEEDFQKNLLRAKKVFDNRMDNLQRSQIEREAQHQKTLEKHQKERAEFEKRLQQEEKEQNRRLEQLQREWDRKREVLAKNKRLAAEEGRELSDDVSLSTSPDFGFAVPAPTDSAPASLAGEQYIINQSLSNESSGGTER